MTVSILVPWREDPDSAGRTATWGWLRRRWEAVWPDAELVVGEDRGGIPFSKTAAVNDAYSRSGGTVLVVADADCWVERPAIERAIEVAEARRTLVVPWWNAYRITKSDSRWVEASDPTGPSPFTRQMGQRVRGEAPTPQTVAMIYVIRRDSFEQVGGMDPRFRGWGSEDVSFGVACDTMLGERKTLLGECWALWHERPRTKKGRGIRVWHGDAGTLNTILYERYRDAQGDPAAMTAICAEHSLGPEVAPIPGVRRPRRPRRLKVREFGPSPTERIVFGPSPGERIVL